MVTWLECLEEKVAAVPVPMMEGYPRNGWEDVERQADEDLCGGVDLGEVCLSSWSFVTWL